MSDTGRIIELRETILENNDEDAERLRQSLKSEKTCLVNLMSAPGSGKTSLLLALKPYFEGRLSWGVMEADIDSDVDARTLSDAGIPAIQLHSGGMCHLDADMTRQGLTAFGRSDLDLIFLENIGNLVCPAEYDTGSALNMTVLSVPEGDDKPFKYPLMYRECSIMAINKIDALPIFDFDIETVKKGARAQNPDIKIFPVSARTGEGVEALAEEIIAFVRGWTKRGE